VSAATESSLRVLERAEHPISRKQISDPTLKVLYRLHAAGYRAYMVGGGVRDLLLGRQPKDFDVSTDARPEEVRRLFRNSRVIGRRFRLVHVYFKEEIVEVSTFRRQPEVPEQEDEDLLITSDNTWGTPQEDAFRRDFTINALFYNIADFTVLDYVGGIEDLERRVLRCIGDPRVRFREDPVRMLRACEFAGRLSFDLDPSSQKAIRHLRMELEKASPARVTEEVVQLMRCGHAAPGLDWMRRLGLDQVLLPELAAFEQARRVGLGDLPRLLQALDRRIAQGLETPDAVLFSILLLPALMVQREALEGRRGRPLSRQQLDLLAAKAVEGLKGRFTLSRARQQEMEQALSGFFRLCEPDLAHNHKLRVARRGGFADALVLFGLLVEATGEGGAALEDWREVARVARSQPPARGPAAVERRGRRRPRRRRHQTA
jgi:poly(A) polymerase